MGLDPNVVLQMLMRRSEHRRALLGAQQERQQDIARETAQREFALGLQSANDPNQDTEALLNTFDYLSPRKAEYLRAHAKSVQKLAKTQAAASSSAGTAAASPLGGGSQPGGSSLPDVLSSLRAVESQVTGQAPSTGAQGFAPETLGAFGALESAAQKETGTERMALAKFAREEAGRNYRATLRPASDAATQKTLDMFARTAQRRGEYDAKIKPFLEAHDAVASMDSLAAFASRAGNDPVGRAEADINLIYAAAKAADRGGRVTDKDFEVQARNGAYGARVAAWMKMVSTGQLTEAHRKGIVEQAKASYRAREKEHRRYTSEFSRVVRSEGLDPANVVISSPPPLGGKAGVLRQLPPGAQPTGETVP